MRRSRTPFYSLAAAAAALALAACSEGTTSPTRGLSASAADLNVVSGPGANQLTITSGVNSLYCAGAQLNGGVTAALDWTIPAGTFGPFAGCSNASPFLDLTSSINVYNPGWSQPFAGSDWIGITTKGGPSSDYRPNPGRYVFQEIFTIPSNVINPVLDLHLKGDNVAAVYLNGKFLAAQPNTDCNAGTCNWNSDLHVVDNTSTDFHIGSLAADTLTFLVSDLPTGFPSTVVGPNGGGPAPQYGCPFRPFQTNGTQGYSSTTVATNPGHFVIGGSAGTPMTNQGAANQAGCENPMGVDYAGTVSWTVPVSTIWCSPGFWKNHGLDLWVSLQGLAYNTHGPYPNAPQTFVGYDFGKKVGSSNPTLLDVISNPSIYGGPATNNVASYISNQLFGTPLSANPAENCPDPLPLIRG